MIDIFFERLRVASVVEGEHGVAVVYDPDWTARKSAFPISVTMPLRAEPYEAKVILPWLANLLPETHLAEIGQILQIAPQNILGLLARMGRDTAGALAFGQPREGGNRFHVVETNDELEQIISNLPMKPMLVGERGVSMSLAGVQEKLGIAIVDGKIAVPLEGTPSTHILKPDVERLKASVQNEAFCLTLARLIGLRAAAVTTGRAVRRSYLLVERYDRIETPAGIQRVHQEDLAQALGIYPKDKYEYAPGGRGSEVRSGPGLVELFGAVERHVSPGARLDLLDGVIFNVICGNTDAHAKNYALQIGAGGSARLAPLYDVLCAKIYPHITASMAQKLGERRVAAEIQGSDWQILARRVGLNPAHTLQRVAELCQLVRENAREARDRIAAMPAGGHELLECVQAEVVHAAQIIERQLANRREGRRCDPRSVRARGDQQNPGPADD
ncbi:MAG: type II toxin-antitoxin system HipA family toxin [Stutzerimonas stutzeri]|nr:MAG: type II toxin-antitoxin system HipA family toxin [Stutzerimonas stutzeri]